MSNPYPPQQQPVAPYPGGYHPQVRPTEAYAWALALLPLFSIAVVVFPAADAARYLGPLVVLAGSLVLAELDVRTVRRATGVRVVITWILLGPAIYLVARTAKTKTSPAPALVGVGVFLVAVVVALTPIVRTPNAAVDPFAPSLGDGASYTDPVEAARGLGCKSLAAEAVRISEDQQPAVRLLKVRKPHPVKDNRTTFRVPRGTRDALILSCEGMGVWSDGIPAKVRIKATIDSDEDTWIYYEPVF